VTHDAGCAAQAQRQIHLLDGRLIDYRPTEVPNIRLSQISPASRVR
jgi:hypothetical protein